MSGISWLMDGGMSYPPSIPLDKAVNEYVIVLREVPSCGLRTAITKLKRGQYENINLDFIPTPANLAAMSRIEARPVIDELHRLRGKHETLKALAAPPEKSSEEQLSRIRALHAQFKAAHAESKVTDRFRQQIEEMTPEQAAYWEKINSLRDAPTISEEQMAMRRKIGKQIESAAHMPEEGREAAE